LISNIAVAKVMLFAESRIFLSEKLSKNFHFVTICKLPGTKYNKMPAKAFYECIYTNKM
jgi:hypothetical protein